ncbi:MAG: hypothetical protein R3B91_09750 [Planctomycetaceae bacterium]
MMNVYLPDHLPGIVSPGRRLALSAGLLLLLTVTACEKQSPQPKEKSQTVTDEFTSTPEQCERDIDNLLDALQPERYGISSGQDMTVNMLNTWLMQCGAAEDFSTAENDTELRAKLLPEAVDAQTSLDQFTIVDAGYLRNSLLVRQMVDSTLTDEQRTNLERAVALFYRLVRTVELVNETPESPPFGPLQAILFGRGTAATRAWIYGMMLRQLHLDAVVIRPREPGEGADRALLVGVVIPEEGVYLFDCALGVPLSSANDDAQSPLPQIPATLAAARENDAIFRQHDLRGLSYPLKSQQLSDIEVLAIGTSSTWAPRFGKLQSALPIPLEIYDGLTPNALQEHGLIDRLVEAGQNGLWDLKDIGIWDYPDQTLMSTPTPEQSEMLMRQSFVLQGPIQVAVNPETGKYDVFAAPKRSLQQARIDAAQGKIDSALQVYLQARISLPHPETPNQNALDWSTYWAALAQYEMHDFGVAAESAEHYLKRPGSWGTAATSLMANALAQQGEFEKAVAILERESVRAAQHLGNQSLVRRWRRLAKGESAVDPQLTATPSAPEASDTQPESSTEEPMPKVESSPDEASPALLENKETPTDLPQSEERPDLRFEDGPPVDLPSAEEAPETPGNGDGPQEEAESDEQSENGDSAENE